MAGGWVRTHDVPDRMILVASPGRFQRWRGGAMTRGRRGGSRAAPPAPRPRWTGQEGMDGRGYRPSAAAEAETTVNCSGASMPRRSSAPESRSRRSPTGPRASSTPKVAAWLTKE